MSDTRQSDMEIIREALDDMTNSGIADWRKARARNALAALSRLKVREAEVLNDAWEPETPKNARELAAQWERRYPIQDGPSVPWYVMEPFEHQCQINHNQTLERIAERGGFGSAEAYAVTHGLKHRDLYGNGEEYKAAWYKFAEEANKAHVDLARLASARGQSEETREALAACKAELSGLQGLYDEACEIIGQDKIGKVRTALATPIEEQRPHE